MQFPQLRKLWLFHYSLWQVTEFAKIEKHTAKTLESEQLNSKLNATSQVWLDLCLTLKRSFLKHTAQELVFL